MTKPFDIPKMLVWKAFQRVKANGGSAGVDNESIAMFETHLGDNLYKLWNRMGSGSYFPPQSKQFRSQGKAGASKSWACSLLPIEWHKRWSSRSSSPCSSQCSTVIHLAIGRGALLWMR